MKKNIRAFIIFLSIGIFAPSIVLAQDIIDLINDLVEIIGAVFPLVLSLAILFFLWALAKYILKTNDVEGRKEARDTIVWGIIIIFVMVSVWGLVNLLTSFVDLEYEAPDNTIENIIIVP